MRNLTTAIISDKRGVVPMQIAILLIAIIAFVALGTEIVMLLLISRQMQSADDVAALTAAAAKAAAYPTNYTQEAISVAAAIFVIEQNGAAVTINHPSYTALQNSHSRLSHCARLPG